MTVVRMLNANLVLLATKENHVEIVMPVFLVELENLHPIMNRTLVFFVNRPTLSVRQFALGVFPDLLLPTRVVMFAVSVLQGNARKRTVQKDVKHVMLEDSTVKLVLFSVKGVPKESTARFVVVLHVNFVLLACTASGEKEQP